MGSDKIKLKNWKTQRTFIDEKGDIYIRKNSGSKVRWYRYDFVDIPIIDPKTSDLLEEEYKRISGIYIKSDTKK